MPTNAEMIRPPTVATKAPQHHDLLPDDNMLLEGYMLVCMVVYVYGSPS